MSKLYGLNAPSIVEIEKENYHKEVTKRKNKIKKKKGER